MQLASCSLVLQNAFVVAIAVESCLVPWELQSVHMHIAGAYVVGREDMRAYGNDLACRDVGHVRSCIPCRQDVLASERVDRMGIPFRRIHCGFLKRLNSINVIVVGQFSGRGCE